LKPDKNPQNPQKFSSSKILGYTVMKGVSSQWNGMWTGTVEWNDGIEEEDLSTTKNNFS